MFGVDVVPVQIHSELFFGPGGPGFEVKLLDLLVDGVPCKGAIGMVDIGRWKTGSHHTLPHLVGWSGTVKVKKNLQNKIFCLI